jgi:hypothetical protein
MDNNTRQLNFYKYQFIKLILKLLYDRCGINLLPDDTFEQLNNKDKDSETNATL